MPGPLRAVLSKGGRIKFQMTFPLQFLDLLGQDRNDEENCHQTFSFI